MELLSVIDATATSEEGVLNLTVKYRDRGQERTEPYGYRPGDPFGLGPQLDAWRAAQPGYPIAPYVVPEPTVDELYPPLEQWRFWSIVDLNFGEGALLTAVETLDDPLKTLAKRILQFPPGGTFTRSNPLFSNAALMAALSIDEAGINALWDAGHNLPDPA